jgi:hypothetical protein
MTAIMTVYFITSAICGGAALIALPLYSLLKPRR